MDEIQGALLVEAGVCVGGSAHRSHFLAGLIAAIADPPEEGGDDEATTEASQPTATATNAASASNFTCRPKSVPEICSIAEQSFDQPLDAYGPVGDQSGPDYGVDYSFVVDTDQSAQAVAVQSEAQMAIAFKATSKKLQGQVNYVAASAYKPGDVPFYEFPLLSTSIGSAEMDQIAAGASPLNIWSVDGVDPALQGVVDRREAGFDQPPRRRGSDHLAAGSAL